MVRLSDLSDIDAEALRGIPCEPLGSEPWVSGPPLARRRLALVTTAGLHRSGEAGFTFSDASYRVIPGETTGNDLQMTHSSVNFDRSGFQQDVNVVFPIDRARELVTEGTLGSLARFHYSFMGAASRPNSYEETAREAAGLMKQDRVDAVLLCPV